MPGGSGAEGGDGGGDGGGGDGGGEGGGIGGGGGRGGDGGSGGTLRITTLADAMSTAFQLAELVYQSGERWITYPLPYGIAATVEHDPAS